MEPRELETILRLRRKLKRIERTVDGIVADYHLVELVQQEDRDEIPVEDWPIPRTVVNGLFYIAAQALRDHNDTTKAGLLRAARNALEDLQALSKGETTIEEVGGVIIELRNAIYSTTSDPDY